jgi:hypothetical protein
MGAFFRRLLALVRRSRLERDLEDERSFHIAMRSAHQPLLPPNTTRQFGSTLRVTEQCNVALYVDGSEYS